MIDNNSVLRGDDRAAGGRMALYSATAKQVIEEREKLYDFLPSISLVHGRGNYDLTMLCTIEAMNFVSTGKATDSKPNSVSSPLYCFIMPIQDCIPIDILNSEPYYASVSRLLGTAFYGYDEDRIEIIFDWIQELAGETALPYYVQDDFEDGKMNAASAGAADVFIDLIAEFADDELFWERADIPGLIDRLTADGTPYPQKG